MKLVFFHWNTFFFFYFFFFWEKIGERTKGVITAKNEATHVSKKCGKIISLFIFTKFHNRCITIVNYMFFYYVTYLYGEINLFYFFLFQKGDVLKEAFPISSFRFLMKNVMTAAQRLYERKCVLNMPDMIPKSGSRGGSGDEL